MKSHERSPAGLYGFGNLGGDNLKMVEFQGGVIQLRGYGCHNCGNAFWTEDDDKRRLPEGVHPCPHCNNLSEVRP